MQCKFAERWYGEHLNAELMFDKRSYAPTQNEEGIVGFDSAIFTMNPIFQNFWPIPILFPFPKGVSLDPYVMEDLQAAFDDPNFLKFKFNLFIQYKRPQHILSNRGTNEYKHWGQPYFKYKIEKKQQKILSTLEAKVENDALIVYACPAFCSKREFWDFNSNGTLIENSNFVKPSVLNGHKKYTFVRGGSFGKGFSKKEDIPNTDLIKEIKRLFKLNRRYEKNTQFIKELASDIDEVIEKLDKDTRSDYALILENYNKFHNSLYRSLSKIFSFLFISDLSWLVGYDKYQPKDQKY
jgi:hypothetical protein